MTTSVAELGRIVRVPSRTTPDTYYTVLIGIDGNTQCTCAGFEFGLDCWHRKLVREEIMTTQALTTIKVLPPTRAIPTRDDLSDMSAVSAYLASSGGVAIPEGLKKKEDIMAVVLAGWEIGVKPMTALRHIMVIKGKTEPDGQLMAGIVLAKEPDARFEILSEENDATTIRFIRPSKNIVREYTYTMQDAKMAQLATQPNWTKFPRDMRRWAAIKRLCRAYAPDIINGIASVTLGDLPNPVAAEPEPEPFVEGESRVVDPARLYSAGDDPDAPIDDSAPCAPADDEEAQTTAPVDPDAPAEPRLIEQIGKQLIDLKGSWPAKDYAELLRELGATYSWANPNDYQKLSAADAAQCLAELRKRSGAPA